MSSIFRASKNISGLVKVKVTSLDIDIKRDYSQNNLGVLRGAF